MSVVKSALSASPDELRANREFYEGRVADLRARRAAGFGDFIVGVCVDCSVGSKAGKITNIR